MDKIVYAGSFDPLTKGHWWVIQEALELANEVVIFIAHNAQKKSGLFTPQERKEMIEAVAKDNGVQDRVNVVLVQNEYVAVKAKKIGANYMIRGIRNSNDFDQEATLQRANAEVLMGAKTLFVMPPRELDGVSSSFVKAMVGPIGWHVQIKKFLPDAVYKKWIVKYIQESVSQFVPNSDLYEDLNGFVNNVIQSYGANDRHYHNLEHLVHCIQELQDFKIRNNTEAINMEALFLAILGHDMVYRKEGNDELMSAHNSLEYLGHNETTQKVHEIIMATAHFDKNGKIEFSDEEKIMCSLDLAILAQPSFMYEEYTKNVRKEYAKFDELSYLNGRKKVVESFLEMPQIYKSIFFSHYEEDAKQNLKNELSLIEKQLA